MEKKFWMVVNTGGGSIGAPTVKHDSWELAEAEARRLVTKHRCEFTVLEAAFVIRPVSQVERVVLQ